MAAVPADDSQNRINQIVGNMNDVAVLPQVVFKIMEMTSSESGGTKALEQAIIVDPGFTVKLLTHANSAHYSLPKKVTSINEALMFLGFKAVLQMAMNVGIYDMFVGKTDAESLRRRGWWRLSIDAAVASKALALELNVADPEECYTAGLLHLIGQTAIDRFATKEYEKVEALHNQGAPYWQAELAVLGVHHGMVSQELTKKWNFPETLQKGVNYLYVDPNHDGGNEISACVALAHKICQQSIQGLGADDLEGHKLLEKPCQQLGIDSSQYDQIYQICTQAVASSTGIAL